jgi:uncharacterized cupredoxin-like copper-binding protein
MRKLTLVVTTMVAMALLSIPAVFAGGDLSKQKPITVRLDLGKDGVKKHKYYPDKLTFETGKLYRLVIHNPSDSKHYFTSLGFASKVFTRKVQVMDDLGAGAVVVRPGSRRHGQDGLSYQGKGRKDPRGKRDEGDHHDYVSF